MQTTNHILMIRPVGFKFNEQTAGNNKFQQASDGSQEENNVQSQALQEFNGFVELLRKNEVDVTVIDDTLQPETPDSIFPNNWLSFHNNAEVFLYPMFSENRRQERREDILQTLGKDFNISKITDLSGYEDKNSFLEGTGSMVLDREHQIVYACLSLRTDKQVLEDFCAKSGYKAVTFDATDSGDFPIYHTNVMMCIGDHFAVTCMESVKDADDREKLIRSFKETGKELIEITLDQMNHFAGNMLQVRGGSGQPLLVMSEQAYLSLKKVQITALEQYSRLIYAPLYTIEKNGGGSARCMLAEIHLEKR